LQQKAELSSLYPFVDLDTAPIMAHDYRFPNTSLISFFVAGSAALVLVGLGSAVGHLGLALNPKAQQFSFLDPRGP
jgi:hypothetical protein